MATVALVWGILAFVGFAFGLIPCLGWLNWFNIPFSLAGVVIAIVAMSKASAERKPVGPAIAGLILTGIAALAGGIRLVIGGGLF